MTQIMAVLIQITVKPNKSTILENSVISNNANLSVIIPNTFAKETSYMTVAKKMIFAYQNNLMISPQTVCAQELAPLNAKTGKSNVTVPLITMETSTRDVRDKMSATPKLKIPTEYSAQENPILMDAHTRAHQKRYCAQPKKDPLDVKKLLPVKIDQPTTKENTAQIPLTVPPFAHQTTSTAQAVLMKMDARNQIFVLKNTEISTETYAQYIVQKTVKMMKYSAQEHETPSTVATARTNASQRTLTNGEKLQDLTVPDGAQLSALNTKFYAHLWSTLVTVAQQKKSAEKQSRISMVCSAQARNSPFLLKGKIIERTVRDEVDSYLQLTIVQSIVKNGWEKFNAPCMKTPSAVNQKLLV